MVNVSMNNDMIGTLRSLLGKKLCALECPRIDEWGRTYCHAMIEADGASVEVSNEQTDIDYFGEMEGMPVMTCRPMSEEEVFDPFPGKKPARYTLMGTVKQITVIDETISVPTESYELTHTVAVAFDTERGTVCLCTTGMFDESIRVGIDKPLENCLPAVGQIADEWRNAPSDIVRVERQARKII